MVQRHSDFYIGGAWRKGDGLESSAVIEAATEEPLAEIPVATEGDMDAAVEAARQAGAQGWAAASGEERAAVIDRFANALESIRADVATAVSRQNGMPARLSGFLEGKFPVILLRYYAELARTREKEETRLSAHNRTVVRRSPIGTVAAIVPWNYPVTLAISKIAPALAAGNTLVVKPSPNTSLDSYLLAEAAQEAGLPPGVINWVPGGREIGAYLVAHPGIDKVAFTGSTAAGRAIAATCGGLIRPVSLELGGKSAAIVLDDADLESLRQDFFNATLANNGQTCVSCSRVLAPRSRYREVVDFVASLAEQARVGDPLDPATTVGPLASAEHRDRVERYIALGKSEGAELVVGGKRPADLERGWYVEPTVFAEVDNASTIGQQEIFGPVLSVIAYDDEEDAIQIANDSPYGLGGSIWTSDIEHGTTLARRIETGTIGVNGYSIDPGSPFGGVKLSGLGREFGPEAMGAYERLQSIYLPR